MQARREFSLCLLTAGLAGCSVAPAPSAPLVLPVWPRPPEQPRFSYEAVLRNASSLGKGSRGTLMRRVLTGEDGAGASFGKPLAVAAGRGRVYVTDTEGRQVFVFDLVRRRTFSFGTRLEGALKKPAGIALDANGLVYVVDTTARRLVIYDALGLYQRHIDGFRDWARATAVAVTPSGDRIYVVDTGGVESEQHQVHVYNRDGSKVKVIGKRGDRPGEFNLPSDIAVAPDGTLWVLDAGNFRVQSFDANGNALSSFGSVGQGIGQFARPRGLAIDRDGLVYVSDASFCNIQLFRADGELLLAIGSRSDSDAPGRYLLPAKLASDETGRLYVVDQYFHKIEVLRRLSDAEGLQLMTATGS
jgi:sugar lactone lactonase YvrE